MTSLKPTTSLRVPYVIYPTDGRCNSSYVSVTMLYCDFNPDNVRQNMLLPELVDSPQVLMLEKPLVQHELQTQCPPLPPRWRMTDSPAIPDDEMAMLLALVRTELNHMYIPQRHYNQYFLYDDIPECFIPPINESICVVGDSHARTLQFQLSKYLWKYGYCYQSNSIHVKALYDRKQPCPADPMKRLLYIRAIYLKDFNEIDLSHCRDIIITYGQWDLAVTLHENYGKDPSLQQSINGAFRKSIAAVLRGLSALSHANRIFFLSMNYTPLREKYFYITNEGYKRPQISYNTPPNVDEFNNILSSEIFHLKEPRFHYLDLSEIIRPLWDSAKDFNHYFEVVGLYMTRKVACTLFPINDTSHRVRHRV